METQFWALDTRPMIFPTKGIHKWLRQKAHVPLSLYFMKRRNTVRFKSKTSHSDEDVNSGHFFINNTAP